MFIIYFDKTTRLFKSHIQTTSPETLVGSDDLIIQLSDSEAYKYNDKWRQLKLNDDMSISIIPLRPSFYHEWNGTEWVENIDEKIRIETDNIRDFRLSLLQRIDDIVKNPFRFESLPVEQKTELSNYRLQLLDIPQQAGFPLDVIWPEVPAILL